LHIEAIENFDPAHWHEVLLDGPKKAQQLENLKTIVRTVGRAGMAYACGWMKAALQTLEKES
jgi:mannonate dehydratase